MEMGSGREFVGHSKWALNHYSLLNLMMNSYFHKKPTELPDSFHYETIGEAYDDPARHIPDP